MRIVKFRKYGTLRIRKRIHLIGIEDECLVVFHKKWYAERFKPPSNFIEVVRPVWHYVTEVSEECYETLRKIERKYGDVVYNLARFDNVAAVRVDDIEVLDKSLKIALLMLLAILDAKSKIEWEKNVEAWKIDRGKN